MRKPKNDAKCVAFFTFRRRRKTMPRAMHKSHKNYAKRAIEDAIFRN
jgi:hypothetical protein